MQQFFGKYRARVTLVYDNKSVDDRGIENRGRIKVMCPAVLGDYESNWCEPCFPFCYDNHGDFYLPKAGDTVWVEFEEGDPNKPIWVGNWFSSNKTSLSVAGLDYAGNHDKVRVINFEDCCIVMQKGNMKIYIGGSLISITPDNITMTSKTININ